MGEGPTEIESRRSSRRSLNAEKTTMRCISTYGVAPMYLPFHTRTHETNDSRTALLLRDLVSYSLFPIKPNCNHEPMSSTGAQLGPRVIIRGWR